MRPNAEAALLAGVAGVLLLVSGYTGVRTVDRFFTLLKEVFGNAAFLIVLAYVFIGIASLGGFTVMFGAYLIWKDRVRLGRIVILIGSGAGFFTLLLFLLVNLRREEFSLLLSVLPAIFGVAIGVVARFLSVPKPLLR
ncbi:MAG: hypothetical protein E6J94_02625 [Methanobacteriota archaeon]|nr:MAG: hypothetical protein E6J99_10005 [Euryarchaeota archaeon]TMA08366.1 MAG: hypothetical protein E6J94_02625 [Euryarchaeota archaeon]